MKTAILLLFVASAFCAADGEAVSYWANGDFPLTADPASPAWKEVRGVTFEHGRYGERIPGFLTEVHSRWTERNLYFLFTCPYESLNLKPDPPAAGETNELWKWDVAEVFIGSDFENIRRYKEFEVSPRGEWIDLAIELVPGGKNRIDWQWNSGFVNKTRIDEQRKTWYLEMQIPMASIAPWKPEPGREFRVNFYRIQGQPRKLLAWRPVNQEWFHRPEAFGKLVLGEEPLFTARALTGKGSFASGIEGPACDALGNIYAVSFARRPTIGKVTPDGRGEVFLEMPGTSLASGIRFDRCGIMYVADHVNHNVFRVDPATRAMEVFAHNAGMNQPNDLAITAEGVLYASDPDWKNRSGQVWRVDRDGTVTRVAGGMGTTNGIEVSPDGKTLYVNETAQRNVWALGIGEDGSLSGKRLLIQFPDYGLDGMRCDVDGNLYITRHGKGTVAKVSPSGRILREIDVLGSMPSNLCFGGPDGRTCYVTEVQNRRLVQFRVDRPGLEWERRR